MKFFIKLFKKFFKKIKKDNKIQEKFVISDCNIIDNNPKYIENVLILYIKNNINELLSIILKKFEALNYIPKIGIEIEFYLLNNYYENEFFENINDFCQKNKIDIFGIEKERGTNQFEIKFQPYIDLIKLINDFENLKIYLLNNYNITFETLHFYDRPMSALQTNISIVDKNTNLNLFARVVENGQKIESNLLEYSVAGLLFMNNLLLKLYINDYHDLLRFDLLINEKIQKNGYIPAPTFVSWGVNNRTAAIRIPVPTDLVNLDNYENEDNLNRRIEFRIPPANSNLKYIIYANLISIFYGIDKQLQVQEKSSFNIIKSNYDLKLIKIEEFSFLIENHLDFFFNYIFINNN